ncbi:MAG: DUF366 family protein [Thermoanaerobacteraceae bacterium]|nr:DUF366 family protein [Thermoanaerobacteraceae bacterium]
MLRYFWTSEEITYDGTQLSSLFAYRTFGIQGDAIVSFQGPCHVKLDKMVDLEDVLSNAPIAADRMLHFVVEHFDKDFMFLIARQRLLICIIKELLESITGASILRNGDDLYYKDGKLSVSIATLSPVSGLIHVGLNITNEGTPVKTAALTDLQIDDMEKFAQTVMRAYAAEIASMAKARCKVRGVD